MYTSTWPYFTGGNDKVNLQKKGGTGSTIFFRLNHTKPYLFLANIYLPSKGVKCFPAEASWFHGDWVNGRQNMFDTQCIPVVPYDNYTKKCPARAGEEFSKNII